MRRATKGPIVLCSWARAAFLGKNERERVVVREPASAPTVATLRKT